jgi:hypothetical protein
MEMEDGQKKEGYRVLLGIVAELNPFGILLKLVLN